MDINLKEVNKLINILENDMKEKEEMIDRMKTKIEVLERTNLENECYILAFENYIETMYGKDGVSNLRESIKFDEMKYLQLKEMLTVNKNRRNNRGC